MKAIAVLGLAVALAWGPVGGAPGEAAEPKAKTQKTTKTQKTAKTEKKATKGETAAKRNAEATRRFETFCGSWLDKLRERERHNRQRITWRKEPPGVVGEYVGYDTKSYRVLPPEDVERTPVGKLVYLELRLRLTGETEADALKSGPQVIEQTEVTELFRYDRGAWVY